MSEPIVSEVALGIATALASAQLDPLFVQLRGHSLEDGARLIRAVIRECLDAEIALRKIAVDGEMFAWLTREGVEPIGCTVATGSLSGELLRPTAS